AGKHAVLVVDLTAEQELRQHENGQQEHDCQEQRRQGIDETRPVIDMPLGAAVAGKSHGNYSALSVRSDLRSCGRSPMARVRRSSVWRIAFCSSACFSTQSRVICCSLRMFLTRPCMPSARLASAAVVLCVDASPPCMFCSRSARLRISSVPPCWSASEPRSVTEESQFSSSV